MSNFKLLYTRNAVTDIREAAEWYDNKQKGLGKRLKEDVVKVIERIERNPFSASVSYANIRTASCSTFPYSIHYSIDELNKTINIISVYHFSRKPKSLE